MFSSFENINSKIQQFINAQKNDWYQLPDKKYKLPLSDAIFCATDIPRNRAFFRAIELAIHALRRTRKNVHVLYAGSGTGILGFFALALGAESCLFLEHNPHSLEFSRKLAIFLGLETRIVFRQGDATRMVPPKKYDLLISETLTSGFVREDFPHIVNHLRKYAAPETIIIPAAFTVTATELDRSGSILTEQRFQFKSQQGFPRKRLRLHHKNTVRLRWTTTSLLYADVKLSSGDCMSYLNEIDQDVQNFSHPLFLLEKFDEIPEKF